MPKPRTYVETYYTLSEDDIQSLISSAKRKDSRAQLELLTIFGNFLQKYTTLLYHGRYNLKDYDIRRFVALFVKDPIVRFYLVRNKLDAKGAKHVAEQLRGIHYMVQRYADPEDVDQTVRLAFFQCLDRYERKSSIPFSGYLYSYYFYILKKMVDAYLIDQLGRKTFPLIDNEDLDVDAGEERQPGFAPPPTPAVDELLGAEEIDEYWVMGETATGPFSLLTVQERQLLKWRYVDSVLDPNGNIRSIRSSDIALRITEHPNTARERVSRVKQKLREYLAEDSIE